MSPQDEQDFEQALQAPPTLQRMIEQIALLPKMFNEIQELRSALAKERHHAWLMQEHVIPFNMAVLVGFVTEAQKNSFQIEQNRINYYVAANNRYEPGNLVMITGSIRGMSGNDEEGHLIEFNCHSHRQITKPDQER